MMENPLHLYRWWLVIGYCLVATVIVLSLIPMPPTPIIQNSDKFQHITAYFVLMGWFCLLYPLRKSRIKLAIAFIFLGVLLEGGQSLTRYRQADIFDILANSSGVLLGWGIACTPLQHSLRWIEHHILGVS